MFLRRPCIFGVVPNSDFTDVEWDAVDDPPQVIKDSFKQGSPRHLQAEPKRLPGPIEPASCKEGPMLSTGGIYETGSSLSRHRCVQELRGRRGSTHWPDADNLK